MMLLLIWSMLFKEKRTGKLLSSKRATVPIAFTVVLLIQLFFISEGFMPCRQNLKLSSTRALSSHLNLSSFPYYNKKNINEERHDGDDDDEDDGKQEWLSWMTSGLRPKRYRYDEVRMREDERLGGLPRYKFQLPEIMYHVIHRSNLNPFCCVSMINVFGGEGVLDILPEIGFIIHLHYPQVPYYVKSGSLSSA